MRPKTNKDGYMAMTMVEYDSAGNLVKRSRLLHRIVLLTFVGEPADPSLDAAHLDGDKLNNHVDNLAWATRTENNRHKQEHGTQPRGEEIRQSKLTAEQVAEILRLKASGMPNTRIAPLFGVSDVMVGKIVRGKNWTHL